MRALLPLLTRHGLLVVATLLAILLVSTAIVRFAGARRAAAAIAVVQGDRLGVQVRETLVQHPRDEAALQALVDAEPELHAIAVLGPARRPTLQVVAAGRRLPPPGPPPPPGLPRFLPDGVTMDVGVVPPGAPRPPADAPPPFRILFEPGEAEPVLIAATWDLAIGVVGGAGLLGLALGVFFVDRRRARVEAAAAEQAHLAHLGEMSAVLAHEIRNPLAALKGHAQLLEERLRGEAGHASAEHVVHGAARLERLVSDLLAFARGDALDPVPIDPIEVAHDALSRVSPDRIELFADDAPDEAVLDPHAIALVLDNLLHNAIQASPEDAVVELYVRASATGLDYVVRDRGPGVPDDVRDRIFDAFVTTRTQGTGLGLALAARVVRAHGGTLTLDDPPDGGARFTVHLPEVPRGADPGR